jgi:hypothetical protein
VHELTWAEVGHAQVNGSTERGERGQMDERGRAGSYKREKIIGHRREDPIRTADP